jgi:two-component system, OmpR family, sensor histidine kinase VicK
MSISSHISDHEILRQITNRSLDAFFIYNLQTERFEYVNSIFEEISGFNGEAINESRAELLSLIHEEDVPLLQKAYERLRHTAFRQSVEVRIRTEAQSEKWIQLTAFAIINDQQRILIAGFGSDISFQKENEAYANKFSTHKNAILEMMAHDLGGPLGAINGLATQLEEVADKNALKNIAEPARLIRKTAQKSIDLIHQLLEKEYLESPETALKKQRVELLEQIEFLLDGYRSMDVKARKQFELKCDADSVFVSIDQNKFLQVLNNLVSNAVKFTSENGHITIGVVRQTNTLLISVEDDGIGIPLDLQPFLFDRFTKARRPGLLGESTVGLGLSIVKRIVEMHRGRIWAESRENEGTRFYIEIPWEG